MPPATPHLVPLRALPCVRDRVLATAALVMAGWIGRSGPARLRQRLVRLSHSRRSASFAQVASARGAVLAASGERQPGLHLATATCLLCLLRFGTWPTWNADAPAAEGDDGGRAWVSVSGQPVGEKAGTAAVSVSREGV